MSIPSLYRCRAEAIVSIDKRGQILLPKDVRERLNLKTNDKLVILSCRNKDGKIFCLTLIKVDEFSKQLNSFLGPVFKDLFKEGG